MARLAGFEPTTTSLEGRCSIQLSYRRPCKTARALAARSRSDKGKGNVDPPRATPLPTRFVMSITLPPCPHLPAPRDQMTASAFSEHGESRDAGFYLTALEYGHYLWQRGFAARAILCLDRAMGADVQATDPIVHTWPIPYAAMAWFLAHTPDGVFIGNPRVHFQHYADRLKAPRRDIRHARAWACWALTRRLRPHLPADPKHAVIEPTETEIATALDAHGLPAESALWRNVLLRCNPVPPPL